MKRIILNDDNLRVEDIENRIKKVRALIIDDNNMVTLCNYGDVYMMPGGKIEDDEEVILTLLRELEEELGIRFEKDELKKLVTIENMAKNYPIRESNDRCNRVCKTSYFVIRSNRKIDKNKVRLTDSELKHNFRIEYVLMNRVLEVIENNEYRNCRNKYFVKEMLIVFKEYLKENLLECGYYKEVGDIDLHIHTQASDGERDANDIIEEAIKKGAQAISFTDHDSILGYKDLVYDKNKIKIISGIELSAFSDIGRMHILGYGFDLNNRALNEKLVELHQNSINNVLSLVDILKRDYGIMFKLNDIEYLVGLDRNIGRPDLAKLMKQYGMVKTIDEAFYRYLRDANEKIRYTNKKLSYQECFDLIKEAGGILSLAHPNSLLLDNNSLYSKIIEMKRNGLGGVEAYHSNVSKDLSNMLIDIALKEDLYLTGGSDYHGPVSKPDINLFTGRNNNIRVKKLNLVRDINEIE